MRNRQRIKSKYDERNDNTYKPYSYLSSLVPYYQTATNHEFKRNLTN